MVAGIELGLAEGSGGAMLGPPPQEPSAQGLGQQGGGQGLQHGGGGQIFGQQYFGQQQQQQGRTVGQNGLKALN